MLVPVPQRLLDLIDSPDDIADLAEAALLIARTQYPELDVVRELTRIDAMAETVRQRLEADSTVEQRLAELNDYLYGELGYGPETGEYYDPRNSYLNDVLERKCGIPITLSILYIRLGRTLGLEMEGISFPGHFLVKCHVEGGMVVIDAYHRGVSLSMEDLHERLQLSEGTSVKLDSVAEYLETADAREIVARMLRNLKAIFLKAKDWSHALTVIEWLVQVVPDTPQELRDRGLVYQELECFRAALHDFEAYLRQEPEATDASKIRTRVLDMRKAAARLN